MYISIHKTTLFAVTVILVVVLVVATMLMYAPDVVAADNEQSEPVTLPIIMYHEVKYSKHGKDAISLYEFESDLQYLQKNGYTTITVTQLINYVYHDEPLPENPIILSFDDGYLNTYLYAYPLIKQYGMCMVLSVIGKDSEEFSKHPSKSIDYAHVTWEQLREMTESGYVEVQNHTYNLHSMGRGRTGCMQDPNESLDDYQLLLAEDVIKLQELLLTQTGQLPNAFAYPYGKASEQTDVVLKKLGFRATLSCNYGVNMITKDPDVLFGLKRVCRSHGTTIQKTLKEAEKTIKKKSI